MEYNWVQEELISVNKLMHLQLLADMANKVHFGTLYANSINCMKDGSKKHSTQIGASFIAIVPRKLEWGRSIFTFGSIYQKIGFCTIYPLHRYAPDFTTKKFTPAIALYL